MKFLFLALLLSWPCLAEEVRIRQQPAQSRVVVRDGVIFCPLQSLAQELGASESFSLQDGRVTVNGKSLELQEDGGEPIVNALEFCKALGGKVTQPERGVLGLYPPAARSGPVNRTDPSSYFISQVRSSTNPTGTVDNSNCGPASLAMAARAFGKWPLEIADNDFPGMMTWIRRTMGHKTDEMQGTNFPWLTRAADQLKLPNKLFLNYDELPGHLARGRLVLVTGYLQDLGLPGGGHAMLVVGARGDDFLINDPGLFYKIPGSAVRSTDLRRFFKMGIAVGP
ncbi:C39 family peptidase [bacterium]|nr:C39 family peptidase [bacterium]